MLRLISSNTTSARPAGIEDYYAARGEAPGRWIGGGCGGVGVSGAVERDAFLALMAGVDPGSGERLRPCMVGGGWRRWI